MMRSLIHESIKWEPVYTAVDIGGTNTAGSDDTVHWIDLANYGSIVFLFLCGIGTAGSEASFTDSITTLKLQQASSSTGTGIKDLTTSGSEGDYDTDTPLDAAGEKAYLFCRGIQLDVKNSFRYVRPYAACTADNGSNYVSCWVAREALIRSHRYLQGTAAGALQYIYPGKADE